MRLKFLLLALLGVIVVLASVFFLKNRNPNIVSYSYEESFEEKQPNPLRDWVTNLKKSDVNISYSFDKNSYTQGNSSLKIDMSVFSPSSKSWYYYLQIPLKEFPNLKDDLSFSLDVKMDKNSAKNIQIGFNLEYLPYTSGIQPIQESITPNKWCSLKVDNLKEFTLNHAEGFVSKIYDANLSDFGRAISKVVILIKGSGSKKYQINLDNLKIYGDIEKSDIFKKGYKDSWHNYTKRVRGNIKSKKESYINLIKGYKVDSCPAKKYYMDKIDSSFSDINSSFKEYKTLTPAKIELLDSYLRKLKSLNRDASSKINIYKMPSMKYHRFTGTNIPSLDILKSYNLRMSRGEYKSIAILIESLCSSETLNVKSDDFKVDLDFYIAKVWYQSGITNTLKSGKFLTQELLLKDDSLIKVDYKSKTNYLKVKYNSNKLSKYINISDPKGKFPKTDTITFNDSKKFKPFKLDAFRAKILWCIVHVPKDMKDGNYTTTVKIIDKSKKVLKEFPINIEVLPFELDKSKLIYSLYYTGKLTNRSISPIDSYNKSKKQQLLELKDIKEHGVLYPTSYENIKSLESTLKIRDKIGFPKDRFYTVGFNVMSSNLQKRVEDYKRLLDKYGYESNSLYVYGVDEASEKNLKRERVYIQKIHGYGAKVFIAGYKYTYEYLGGYIDLFNYANAIFKKDVKREVVKWHGIGGKIFAYASPQVGVENPEIYRRNFGCKLWQNGFDGSMNWAYQAHRGAFWNDFDTGSSRLIQYREEAFTYPTTDGIVGTIEWEGFRDAITDVRYISTLENLKDKLEREGEDVYSLNLWIKNIDCNSNLDRLREDIIDKILEYR